MSRAKVVALAVFTVWPWVYLFGFFAALLAAILYDRGHDGHASATSVVVLASAPLHLLTIIDMVALLVIYLVHLLGTEGMRTDTKVAWGIALLLGGLIAMPFYWYFRIWRPLGPRYAIGGG